MNTVKSNLDTAAEAVMCRYRGKLATAATRDELVKDLIIALETVDWCDDSGVTLERLEISSTSTGANISFVVRPAEEVSSGS